ncbi:MAG: hypothetical protein MJZ90_10295 [Bacteroidales bacterium]|nr:hypothetical protein [Bacteroidales bacterium]
MAEVNEVIIDVKVNASESAKRLAEVKQRIAEVKSEQKELNRQIRAGGDSTGALSAQYATNAAELKKLAAEEKMYTAQLQVAVGGNEKFGDSLVEQAALLAKLKSEYRGLTKEQREGEGGKAMQNQIAELDKSIKGADATIGDFQRNVGNYSSALSGLGNNAAKVSAMFQGGFRNGLATAGQSVKAFGKSLLTTPIGWIMAAVAALVAILDKLKQSFKQNDDAGTALSRAMATFKPILTAINAIFQMLAKGVAAVAEGLAKVVSSVLNLIPAFRESSNAARELVDAQDMLEEQQRQYSVEIAKNEQKISENNAKIADKMNETVANRIKYLRDNAKMEEKNAEMQKDLAAERLRIAKEEQKKNQDYSDESKDRIAQLEVEMIRAQTAYSDAMVSINKRTSSAIREIENEEKQRLEEQKRRWKEAAEARRAALEKQNEEVRKAEDLALQLVTDYAKKAQKEIEYSYNRQIQDLKKRLNDEKNLTKEARDAINAQIVSLEKIKDNELLQLTEKAIKERFDREKQITQSLQDARIAIISDATEREVAAAKVGYDRQIEEIRKRLEEEKDLTVKERADLNNTILALQSASVIKENEIRTKARSDAARKEFEEFQLRTKNEYEQRVLDAQDNESRIADVRLEEARNYYDSLVNIDAETKAAMFENEEAYKKAVIAAEEGIREARKISIEQQNQQIEQVASTLHTLSDSMSEIFEAVAGDSEEFEKFKKMIAIADAAISLGQAIASAVASSTAGDPYTMSIRIATNVAAITSAFASLVASIKSASIPSAPSFEEGGIVPGNSLTGDHVRANLNSREMVLTMEDQKNLLSLIRAGAPLATMDARILAAAMRDALKDMPAPLLDYSEFSRFEKRVKMNEKMVRI